MGNRIGVGLDSLHIAHLSGRAHGHAVMARMDVEMQMKDLLPASRFGELLQCDTVRLERRLGRFGQRR